MGRAFEYRKDRKMKRWSGMAKAFTRIGREIAMAVKEGGGDPNYNARLRMAIQNAKAANMPKTNVENAIKKATSKDAEDYDQVLYEGYAPHGIALMVETATNNINRTVANVRHVFSKYGGSLGTSGSVEFMFHHRGVIKIKAEGVNLEDLELELIDFGLEEIQEEEDGLLALYTNFGNFGSLQKALEERNMEVENAEAIRIPVHAKKLDDAQAEDVIRLIEKMEEDDDVLSVFHNMDMSE